MRLRVTGPIVALMLGLSVQQAAAVTLSAAVARTEESTTNLNIGLQKDFQSRWWQSDVGALTGYWEAGYTFWIGKKQSDFHSV